MIPSIPTNSRKRPLGDAVLASRIGRDAETDPPTMEAMSTIKTRVHLTLNPRILEMADELMGLDGHSSMVSLVETLIREESRRRSAELPRQARLSQREPSLTGGNYPDNPELSEIVRVAEAVAESEMASAPKLRPTPPTREASERKNVPPAAGSARAKTVSANPGRDPQPMRKNKK